MLLKVLIEINNEEELTRVGRGLGNNEIFKPQIQELIRTNYIILKAQIYGALCWGIDQRVAKKLLKEIAFLPPEEQLYFKNWLFKIQKK